MNAMTALTADNSRKMANISGSFRAHGVTPLDHSVPRKWAGCTSSRCESRRSANTHQRGKQGRPYRRRTEGRPTLGAAVLAAIVAPPGAGDHADQGGQQEDVPGQVQ